MAMISAKDCACADRKLGLKLASSYDDVTIHVTTEAPRGDALSTCVTRRKRTYVPVPVRC